MGDEIGSHVDGLAVARVLLLRIGLDECKADGAAVIEFLHRQQTAIAARLRPKLLRLAAEVIEVVEDEVEVLERVVLVTPVPGHIGDVQHAGQRNAG